jgi:hypothetical protein
MPNLVVGAGLGIIFVIPLKNLIQNPPFILKGIIQSIFIGEICLLVIAGVRAVFV